MMGMKPISAYSDGCDDNFNLPGVFEVIHQGPASEILAHFS
jgi:hypothetical protein